MKIGYRSVIKDVDARMWSDNFDEFEKCPTCGLRFDFLKTNPHFRIKRRTSDICSTWDAQKVVTDRFRVFAEVNGLKGGVYTQLSGDENHFHFHIARVITVNLPKSNFTLTPKCSTCGRHEAIVTRGNPTWLNEVPAELGFYRTDLLLGSGNTRHPQIIMNEATVSMLREGGITGFLRFKEVFGEIPAPAIKIPTVQMVNEGTRVESALAIHPLLSLSSHPAPGSTCKNKRFSGERKLIRVEHCLLEPGSEKEIAMAGKLLAGMSGQLLELYRLHNGMELYAQPKTDNMGVRLAPISEWKDLTKEARNFLVKGVRHPKFVAVGEVPRSGNYFVVPLSGEYSGTIGLIDHETGSVEPFADDLNHFLRMASEDPVSFLMDTLGGYIRYSAEGSDDWIPEKYLPDIRVVSESDRK